MVTWHLTMKLFPAKCHERATLRKLWRQTGNSSLLPGKQFTVTRQMLTAVARDRWNFSAVFKFCFCFVLLYNKSLNDWSLGEQWFCFPRISMFPSTSSRETLTFSGNKIHCSPRDQSLSVYYSPPTEWIMRKPNKNEMAGVNSRFASVSESEILKDTRRCSTRENKEGHEIWNESFQR